MHKVQSAKRSLVRSTCQTLEDLPHPQSLAQPSLSTSTCHTLIVCGNAPAAVHNMYCWVLSRNCGAGLHLSTATLQSLQFYNSLYPATGATLGTAIHNHIQQL